MDYLARQKVGGINLNSYHLFQLPIPAFPSEKENNWHREICLRAFELTYTSWDLEHLAKEYNYTNEIGDPLPPFIYDENRRHLLRCEIDSIVSLMYNLSKEELTWILDAKYPSESFRVLKESEIKEFGKYKTQENILKVYDKMAEAIKTGKPYQTILDPPPGPTTDAQGNFIPMAQWDVNNWPVHIHKPRSV